MANLNTIVIGKRSAAAPLIMLHGWNRSAQDMLPLAELLAPYMEIHLIDLPGFGKSDLPDGDWDTTQYAECVLRYITEKNLHKVNLLGHSFGGRISLRLASLAPERLDHLILLSSHGLKRKRKLYDAMRVAAIPKLGKLLKVVDRGFGLKLYSEKFLPRFASRDYLNAGALKGTFVKTVNEDQTEQVSTIKTPTLLLWGENDSETPPELGKRFNALITNSRLIVMPNKGHDLFQDIDAHLSAYYVKGFLIGACVEAREAANV